MADANTAKNNVSVEDKQAVGAPPGVTNKDLSDGENGDGPKAPVINNQPPVKEPTPEEKAAAEKAEADKKAADEAAAKKKAEEDAAAKKKADEESATKKKEYPVYNDEAADSVVGLLKDAGVTADEADTFFRAAVEANDLSKVDVAGLTAKVGKEKATLIMVGVKDYYNRNAEAVKKVTDEVYKVTGGEAQFETLKNWAIEKEKVDTKFAAELNDYRAMLEGTPTQARLAAQELLRAYNADPKTKSLTVNMTHGDKPGSQDLSLEYISRSDYITQLKVAESKADKAEISRLNARRSQSVKQEKAGQR